ncbi:MAG: hypothetical protein GWP10_05630, partial [Nitrospiraceae bacterium]|nr:hypothetical protein [Nitrospiraceae bacterium]
MTRCIQRTNSPFQGLKRKAFLWNGWLLTFFIAVGLCFFAKAASCNILLSSNPETCTKDDELVFSIGYDGSYPMGVDAYVAISIPNDPNLYFWPDFGTTPKPCAVGWIPEAFPLTPFFSYRFVGPEPQGSYRVYAALFKTGTFDASTLVGGIPSTSVTYTGAGGSSPVISVEPADGSVVGTQPTFRISFIGPIDLESVIDHSEFQIESVSSGKRVRVYTDDSNVHWVE